MSFIGALLFLLMVGAGVAALMNTKAGQVGCGILSAIVMLVGIGAVTLFLVGVFGFGCAVMRA